MRLAALSCALALAADPQTALWGGIRKQLSGPAGEEFFEKNVRNTALPALRGTLASALINDGVSRLLLKMPGADEPDVELVVHNGDAKPVRPPDSGTPIEFSGVAQSFRKQPFLLTIDVHPGGLRGIEFQRPKRQK